MLLPKRGFYHPVAILVLAAITLSFAVIFYLNSSVFFKAPEKTPQPQTSTSPPPLSSSQPLKSSVDETATWKTYTNATYKYSLKIPNDWSINYDNARSNDEKLAFMYSKDYKEVGDTQVPHLSSGVMLQVQSGFSAKSYDEFIVFVRPNKTEYPNEGTEIIIDGEKGIVWVSNNRYSIPGQKGYQVSVFHKEQGYSLFIISSLPQDTLLDQILSTFKFTD